ALATAEEVLSGTLDVLYGCARLRHKLLIAGLSNDPSYLLFLGVWSESHHLPLGPDRQHWNAEALKRKDEEMELIATHYRSDVVKAIEERLATHRGSPQEVTGLKRAKAIMKAVKWAVVDAQLGIDELTGAAAADGTITMFGLVQSE